MTDAECVDFLQWALPRLGRRWAGYRKVRRLVAKRLGRRLAALGSADLDAYRRRLESQPQEWEELDALLGIPISRFYRDCEVFDAIGGQVLPALAQAARGAGRTQLAAWSAGCASGEEPYTLAILWHVRLQAAFAPLALRIVASDADPALLQRARIGCYTGSSLKELPADLRAAGFERRQGVSCVRAPCRAVEFVEQDLRRDMPAGAFDLVFARNGLMTYYAPDVQRAILARIAERMRPRGALVVGLHESLPDGLDAFAPWVGVRATYRRSAGPS
jgi:chemotaxis protein methyltransferase CheR